MTIPAEIAATGFDLPAGYAHACRLGIRHLSPWHLLRGEAFLEAYAEVNDHDAERILLPFAVHGQASEVACFEVLPGPAEAVTVLLRGEGRTVAEFPTFWAFFRQAVEDMIHEAPAVAVDPADADPEVTWEWFKRRAGRALQPTP